MVQVQGQEIPAGSAVAVVERVDVFEQEVRHDGRLQPGNLVGGREMDHVGEERADVAFAFDSVMDREAVRPLYFHIAFPEQVAVRLIALIDFVEHDLVIDVADVGDACRQRGVLVREVQVQLGKFAEPRLGVVAVPPCLVGRVHGVLGFLAGAAHAFHLVGGEQFLTDGMPYVVPAHDAGNQVP